MVTTKLEKLPVTVAFLLSLVRHHTCKGGTCFTVHPTLVFQQEETGSLKTLK